jgi:UDP-N-acetylmuramoyl-tripeptide--D-alanyl-D-alanine ligase
MRMQVSTRHGVTYINDAYNANPNSMKAALRTLSAMNCSGKKTAVLGDMLELGEISASAHYETGALAAEIGLDALLVIGKYAADIARGAQDAGMPQTHILTADSHAALAKALVGLIQAGDLVLLKASRGMALERVLEEYEKRVT